MKTSDRQSQHSPPRSTRQGQGRWGEARALFGRMKGEVMRQTEREREEAGTRGALSRLLLALTIAACVLAAATMLYGIYNFPDAPIRPAGGGYVGKHGEPHTRDDYEAFILWGKVMFTVVPTVFVLGFAFVVTDSRRRRGRASQGPRARK